MPVGSNNVGSHPIGLPEDRTESTEPRWSTTGLETIWGQRVYEAPTLPPMADPVPRLFSMVNDGGVFLSQDQGLSWAWVTPNICHSRLVTDPDDPGAPTFASQTPGVVDYTAMAGRHRNGRVELLLAATKVEFERNQGRVMLSRDGSWSWNGRTLCGLPEGAIWSLVEAGPDSFGGPIYCTVVGHGVYWLPEGKTTWLPTGPFRWLDQVFWSEKLWSEVEPGTMEAGTSTLAALNPLRMVVVRDRATNAPKWLVAALAVDGINNVKVAGSGQQVPQAERWAGLYRMKLDKRGNPAWKQWLQFAGAAFPSSFPLAWRFVTGLAATPQGGVVVTTQSMTAGGLWYEGAVIVCEDLDASPHVFRLVMCHPAARDVATVGDRVFVALGLYGRLDTPAIAPWHAAGPEVPGTHFEASKVYFAPSSTTPTLGVPTGPIGLREVLVNGSALLQATHTLQQCAELQAAFPSDSDQLTKSLMTWFPGGYKLLSVSLKDWTGTLHSRNLAGIVQLQSRGSRLFVGLQGSSQWMQYV